MKLEPVGYYNPDAMDEAAAGKRGGGVILWARQSEDDDRVAAYAIPEGYVVVPVEPTEAMVQAAYKGGTMSYSEIYRIMLAAAKEQS